MTNLEFLKTLTATAALSIAFCESVRAADTGDCGPNCRYSYDSSTHTLTYTGTGENGAGIINIPNTYYELSGTIKNMIIEEGITDILRGQASALQGGEGTGKLVLPSTLQNLNFGSVFDLNFKEIEINSTQLSVAQAGFRLAGASNPTVIMSANANISFDNRAFEIARDYPASLTIACKGKPETCLEKFGNSLNNMTGTITANYYEERDKNGKLTLKYNDTGYETYDANGNVAASYTLGGKLMAQYDTKGNVIARYDENGTMRYAKDENGSSYSFDANGNLSGMTKRGPFTIPEANALTKDGPVNTVTITW